MTELPTSERTSATHPEAGAGESSHPELEEYAGGYIQAHHGYIPAWLLVVYFALCVWGLYYAYQYWGGLGPGRF
jgi:hypothetical protein